MRLASVNVTVERGQWQLRYCGNPYRRAIKRESGADGLIGNNNANLRLFRI